MNCLKSSLSKDGAVAARAGAELGAATGASGGGVGVGTRDAAGAGVEVSLPLVGAGPGVAPASSSLPVGGGFRQELQRARGLAIALAG